MIPILKHVEEDLEGILSPEEPGDSDSILKPSIGGIQMLIERLGELLIDTPVPPNPRHLPYLGVTNDGRVGFEWCPESKTLFVIAFDATQYIILSTVRKEPRLLKDVVPEPLDAALEAVKEFIAA